MTNTVADNENSSQAKENNNSVLIQRCPHDSKNPYVMVNSSVIRNSSLSFELRGFLAFLLSLPDDWKISIPHIQKTQNVGREKVRSMIRKLIDAGYMKKQIVKDKQYKNLNRTTHLISEYPKFKKCFPRSGFQPPENLVPPPIAHYVVSKEEVISKEELKEIPLRGDKEKPASPSSAPHKEKIPISKKRFREHVFLTQGEYEKLLAKFGEADILHKIERLNAYIGSKNKRYASHYHTILVWDLRDQDEIKKKSLVEKKPKIKRKSGARMPEDMEKRYEEYLKIKKEKKNE